MRFLIRAPSQPASLALGFGLSIVVTHQVVRVEPEVGRIGGQVGSIVGLARGTSGMNSSSKA
jgi:hypothetical protein